MGFSGAQMDDSDGVDVGNMNMIYWNIKLTTKI